jgi:hypothetical protein
MEAYDPLSSRDLPLFGPPSRLSEASRTWRGDYLSRQATLGLQHAYNQRILPVVTSGGCCMFLTGGNHVLRSFGEPSRRTQTNLVKIFTDVC